MKVAVLIVWTTGFMAHFVSATLRASWLHAPAFVAGTNWYSSGIHAYAVEPSSSVLITSPLN